MKKIELFLLLLIAWVLLVSPLDFGGGMFPIQDLVAGVLVALLATFLMREVATGEGGCRIAPLRIFWFLAYVVMLAGYVIKANVDVAYRVLHPDMPIRPGIVKVKTDLRSPAALTLLANSITLTPGTLTVNALEDGTLYVHWIYVYTQDAEEATAMIIGRFEWFLKRIFE